VPRHFDRETLAHALQYHADLQRSDGTPTEEVDDNSGNGVSVCTLARDVQLDCQVATICFRRTPSRLEKPEGKDRQVAIEVHITSADQPNDASTVRLAIDDHFSGITVLFSPTTVEHEIDVLALSGLGSHPFGSFVHKADGHMWLSDSLPGDMPTARVMIYGYESGLWNSASTANIGDLAGPIQIALSSLLRSEDNTPLILIGHSLGGLLIQEALIRITDPELLKALLGVLFFGVPNDGMAIESLIPVVNDQPNRFLLESLSTMNSQVLELLGQNFSEFQERTNLELFCFYETQLSPTAAMVRVVSSAGTFH